MPPHPIAADPEYQALLAYAAQIGADPSLVQGAGGNVSLKRDGVLWVKASGTWLAQATERPIMVPVQLAPMLAVARGADLAVAEHMMPFVIGEHNPLGLRPSIETTMHGVLPHPVVVHVHCVETIAWAALRDAERAIAARMAGLRWGFVPYRRPGAPLTQAILQRMRPGTDVLVLGNHGLTVGADTVEQAADLVAEVQQRLCRPVRAAPAPAMAQLALLAAGSDYVPAPDSLAHGTATDPLSFAIARRGSLYPDHVIFLGPGVATFPAPDPAPHQPAMLVVPGHGVLLRRDASAGAAALARCLADVTARLDPSDELAVLTGAQESELLGWDAEQYRQRLDTP